MALICLTCKRGTNLFNLSTWEQGIEDDQTERVTLCSVLSEFLMREKIQIQFFLYENIQLLLSSPIINKWWSNRFIYNIFLSPRLFSHHRFTCPSLPLFCSVCSVCFLGKEKASIGFLYIYFSLLL